jgi:tetratricopeptide (TPR) repeat protein
LQENADQRYVQMGSSSEIQSLAESSDILAVKNTVENLTALAAIYPGWRPYLAYGQCRYRWLQGDLQGALDVLLPAFELALPTRHNAFPCLAAARVRLLAELGRSDEAVRFGEAYRELCEREQLICLDHGISIGLAKALCDLGRHAAAVSAIEAAIDRSERLGSEGLALGVLYETRARVAIDMGDQSAFKRFAERCAHEYKKARNLGLTARFSRMIEDARQRHIEGNAAAADILSSVDSSASDSSPNSVHSRILECLDQSDRARCALTLLLQSTESACGYLYGVRDAKPVLLAALPEVAPDDQLTSWVLECLQAELARGSGSTGETADDPTHSEVARRFTDADGQVLEPIFLFAARQRPLRVAAVLALQVSAGARTLPPRALLDELAEELLEHGDVNGMYVEEAATTAD